MDQTERQKIVKKLIERHQKATIHGKRTIFQYFKPRTNKNIVIPAIHSELTIRESGC